MARKNVLSFDQSVHDEDWAAPIELGVTAHIDFNFPPTPVGQYQISTSAEFSPLSNLGTGSVSNADGAADSVWYSENPNFVAPIEPGDFATSGGKWGASGTLGTAGGNVTWSIAGAGLTNQTGQTFFSGSTVELSSFLPADFLTQITNAFAAWSQVANITFTQVADGGGNFGVGTTGTIRIGGGFIDGFNPNGSVVGRAFFPPTGGNPNAIATHGDLVFDSGDAGHWDDTLLLAVALHEIGHTLGLDHVPQNNPTAVMNPTVHLGLPLQSDDIAGARAIYGTQGAAGSVSINDVAITEGNAGTQVMTFTVTRAGGTAAFTVNFTTANGTATAGDGDYVATSGTLSFGSSVNTQTISITINGDNKAEANETFNVVLSGGTSGIVIADNTGLGTITNDDGSPINGTEGPDNLTGTANPDTINGLGGDDTIEGRGAGDFLDGGTGTNTLSYFNSPAGVFINLGNGATGGGDAQGDNFASAGVVNFQNLLGSAFNDVLFGDGRDNVIEGRGGADTLHGGTGTNTLSYASSSAGVYINLGNGGTGGGDAQGDNFAPSGVVLFQNIIGSAANDVLFGDGLDNTIEGGAGADALYGGGGTNTLSYASSSAGVYINLGNGGTGGGDAQGDNFAPSGVVLFQNATGSAFNDVLFGDGQANIIDGRAGADTLFGGANNDTFQFRTGQANGDTVIDFTGNGAAAGDQFVFSGFGTAAQGATFTQVGASNQWQIHSGIDGHNEFITLSNGATVHQSDFLFG